MGLNRLAARPALIAICLLVLSACLGPDRALVDEAGREIAASQPEITALVREGSAASSPIRMAGRPWYGSSQRRNATRMAGAGPDGIALPANLEMPDGIALSIPTRTGLQEAAELITRTSGLPVTVNLRLPPGSGGDAGTGRLAAVPRLGQPVRHDGPLSRLLNRIASEYNVFWRFDGHAIALSAYETRTWSLPVPPGSTALSSAFSGLAGGEDSISLNRQATIDDWGEISQILKASIESPPAVVTMSPGIGRVSVTGRPTDITAADRIIQEAASLASHRISLEVGIYYLDADRSSDFSFGLTRFGEFDGTAVEEPPTNLIAAGGSVAIIGAEAGAGIGYALDFENVGRHTAVVTHRTASTVAVSGTVAPIRLVSTRNYVSSVSVSEEGQQTIETDKVDDGLVIQIIPRLIDRSTLRLSLQVGQADLLGFDVFREVQLPRVDYRMIANDVVMSPGETLVLSGYEQGTADVRDEGGILSTAAAANIDRVMLVVLVRPTLLPHHTGH